MTVNRVLLVLVAAALAAPADDIKQLPGQAGNDGIDLAASVIVNPLEIQQALGADLGPGYIVVRMKAIPKTGQPLRISPDDFTMISRKDGQRSSAMDPEEIAGTGGTLVVRSAVGEGSGPVSQNRINLGVGGIGMGNSGKANPGLDTKVEPGKTDAKDSPLLTALKKQELPDKETKEPLEGLLYFPLEGKIKPKDVAVVYKGPAGKLIIEFQNPPKGKH